VRWDGKRCVCGRRRIRCARVEYQQDLIAAAIEDMTAFRGDKRYKPENVAVKGFRGREVIDVEDGFQYAFRRCQRRCHSVNPLNHIGMAGSSVCRGSSVGLGARAPLGNCELLQ
jgi:hypothetical protein